jgi:hypothetical protein
MHIADFLGIEAAGDINSVPFCNKLAISILQFAFP